MEKGDTRTKGPGYAIEQVSIGTVASEFPAPNDVISRLTRKAWVLAQLPWKISNRLLTSSKKINGNYGLEWWGYLLSKVKFSRQLGC